MIAKKGMLGESWNFWINLFVTSIYAGFGVVIGACIIWSASYDWKVTLDFNYYKEGIPEAMISAIGIVSIIPYMAYNMNLWKKGKDYDQATTE